MSPFVYFYVCMYVGVCVCESELFTGDMSKDNHSPGPVIR